MPPMRWQGWRRGGDGSVGWTWLDNVSDGCGIEVGGGGVDTALPQVQFNIAQAHNRMIERKGKTRWCAGDKKHTTISHSRECNYNNKGHSNKGGQEEAGCGAGQQWGGGRLRSESLRSSPQRHQCKGRWRMEGNGGQRRCWRRMPAGNGGRWWSTQHSKRGDDKINQMK